MILDKYTRGMTFVAEGPDYTLFADERGQLVRIQEIKAAPRSRYDRLLTRIAELSNCSDPN